MGQVLGAAVIVALLGALFGWILRKMAPLALSVSYALGIIIAVIFGSYLYSVGQPGTPYGDALTIYGIGGVLALPLLLVTARRRRP